MHDLMESRALTRAERIAALRADLMPRIRRLSPELSDDEADAAAIRMAEYRLADEEAGGVEP